MGRPVFRDLKSFKELSLERKAVILGTLATAVLSMIIYGITGGGFLFYVTLVFGSALTFATDKLSRFDFEDKLKSYFNELHRGEQDLRCIGRVSEALTWLRQDGRSIHRVENTVFTRVDYRGHSDVDGSDFKRFIEFAHKAIGYGAHWTDICTPSQTGAIDDFRANLRGEMQGSYTALMLASELPIIQCMIVEFKGSGDKAVLYGWSFPTGSPRKEYVFHSENEGVVSFFSDYMSELRSNASPVTRNGASNVMKQGPSALPT